MAKRMAMIIKAKSTISSINYLRLLKKRCPDIIGAGGLGWAEASPDISGSPSLKKSPKIGGLGG